MVERKIGSETPDILLSREIQESILDYLSQEAGPRIQEELIENVRNSLLKNDLFGRYPHLLVWTPENVGITVRISKVLFNLFEEQKLVETDNNLIELNPNEPESSSDQ